MQRLDWITLSVYAAIVIGIGAWAGRREKSLNDFFLAGRSMNGVLVMISIYATAASALTFIGVPGAAYSGNFNYVTMGLGSIVGRFLIAWLLLGAYYKGNVITAYQLLGQRFGTESRTTGTIFFMATRLLASGVRLAGCAIALKVVFGMSLPMAILLVAGLAAVYTTLGGIKAVIYTDLLQFCVFFGGAVLVLFLIIDGLPGGFVQFLAIGLENDKFDMFIWDWSLNNGKSFLAGSLFGCVMTFAALGTDQDLVQRMLTCKSLKSAQRAVIYTGIMDIPIVFLFLSIGAGLFAYYQINPSAAVEAFSSSDYVFPYFIKTVLPAGLRGLLLAGLLAAAMSSLDSAVNALSSTYVVDIYLPYVRPDASEADQLRVARRMVLVFAAVLAVVALMFGNATSILWLGFRSVGYTYGALLGVFLLAVLVKRPLTDRTNVVAMITSVPVVLLITSAAVTTSGEFVFAFPWLTFAEIPKPYVAWPWGVIIGTAWTFALGWIAGAKRVS